MSEPIPSEKPKKKGLPTWVWFIGTFAVVSLLGNIVFGGNTWITSGINFINNTIASFSVEEDRSKDPFCLTGAVSQIDRDNTITVVNEADALVATTAGAIGYASMTDDPEELAKAINSVRESGAIYLVVGERLLTATNCNDATYEYLMKDFGDSMVAMGKNFEQWNPETLSDDPLLLITVTPLIEQAANRAQAIITYVESSN
jgi:hypothetical protein